LIWLVLVAVVYFQHLSVGSKFEAVPGMCRCIALDGNNSARIDCREFDMR